jgi:hypothetical protein
LDVFKPLQKGLAAVMEKHGLTAKAVEGIAIPEDSFMGDTKARLALGRLVKKPEGFTLDMMAAQEKAFVESKLPPTPKPDERLADVKIDGDKARGTIIGKASDGETHMDVFFVKKSDGWRLIPTYIARGVKPGVPPAKR